MQIRFMRLPEVLACTGTAESTHFYRINQGLMVKAVKLGPRMAGYPEHEIAALCAARLAGKTDDEVRSLVTRLMGARATAMKQAEPAPESAAKPWPIWSK